jgi:8-hydroxy-5-deazaflavin:NADPH oxidoreductase
VSSITILGSGNMARGVGTRAVAGGHDVQILDRDPEKADALAGELGAGAEGRVTAGTLGDPVAGDIVVLAVVYPVTVSLVQQHAAALDGKVIVDISNPINMETFDLATPPGISAAEEVATAAPAGAKVVKAFNTTFAPTLVSGAVSGQPLDVFIAADDDDAKAAVSRLVESGGARPLDAGVLARARLLEALGLLHITLQMTRGTQFATALKLIDP